MSTGSLLISIRFTEIRTQFKESSQMIVTEMDDHASSYNTEERISEDPDYQPVMGGAIVWEHTEQGKVWKTNMDNTYVYCIGI